MAINHAFTTTHSAQTFEWKARIHEIQARADQATANTKLQCDAAMNALRIKLHDILSLWSELRPSAGCSCEKRVTNATTRSPRSRMNRER